MGVTFRSGGYIRHVNFGGRTIKDGEAAAIWDANGIHRQIIGPKRVWLLNSTIRFLTRRKAESHQYLKVSHRDGRIEHISGPAVLYENPAYHDAVRVEDGIRLCSHTECVVTFASSLEITAKKVTARNKGSDGSDSSTIDSIQKSSTSRDLKEKKPITRNSSTPFNASNHHLSQNERRIIYGPTLFIPEPSEYVQTFTWLNHTPSLQILRTSNSTSFDVTIPTSDGFTFDTSLVLSYTITSIDRLISNKTDPIQQLYNGVCYDSQTLGDGIPSKLLKSNKESIISKLSQMDTYPSLIQACNECGMKVDRIQVTSMSFCPSLRTQIDNEQNLAATIQTEVAKKTHSYQLRQMEMEAEQIRVEECTELKKKEVRMNDELDLESYKLKLAALERKVELEMIEAKGLRDIMKVKEESVLEFLMKMKQMGVDMTKFMTTYGGIVMADEVVGTSNVLKKTHFGASKTS